MYVGIFISFPCEPFLIAVLHLAVTPNSIAAHHLHSAPQGLNFHYLLDLMRQRFASPLRQSQSSQAALNSLRLRRFRDDQHR